MASARDRTAAAEVILLLPSRRQPKMVSARSESSQVTRESGVGMPGCKPLDAGLVWPVGYDTLRLNRFKENHILHRAFTLSKLIALLAVAFLLSAALDRVPDCPELLNSNRDQVASLQAMHGADLTAIPSVPYLICFGVSQPVAQTQDFGQVLAARPVDYVSWSGYQASDTSPPLI
jgi:hypothetical protein